MTASVHAGTYLIDRVSEQHLAQGDTECQFANDLLPERCVTRQAGHGATPCAAARISMAYASTNTARVAIGRRFWRDVTWKPIQRALEALCGCE